MISIDEAAEWIPHGRDVVANHPKFDNKDDDDLRLGVAGVSLLADDQVTPGQEQWHIDTSSGEELYCCDKTAVLSRGDQTVKCFTLSSPVHQALRCTFYSYPDRPRVESAPVASEPEGDTLDSVCLRDDEVLRVYCDSGEDYNVALQMPVRQCWPTKFGMLVERQVNPVPSGKHDRTYGPSILFFLLHPLDDYTRVVMKQGTKFWELQDQNISVVHTDTDPSIVVTYNSVTDTHSVWRLRRTTQAESEKCQYLPAGSNSNSNQEVSGTPSSHQSHASSTFTPSRHQSHHSTNSPSQSRSIGTPFHSRSGTPTHSRPQSRTHSPMSTMASMIRTGDKTGCQSPTLLSKIQSRFSGSPLRSPGSNGTPTKLDESSFYENKPPLDVTICLEHMWSEPLPPQGQPKDVKNKACKVFLSTDLVGQQMICLLRTGPAPGLQLIKMECANDNPDRIIFGAVRKIAGQDAVPVSGLNMILVLDMTGSLVLYTGTTRVSRIMLPTSPTTILSQEISALALDNVNVNMESTPSTPLNYKRPSLLTSSRPPSAALPNFGNPDSSIGEGTTTSIYIYNEQ